MARNLGGELLVDRAEVLAFPQVADSLRALDAQGLPLGQPKSYVVSLVSPHITFERSSHGARRRRVSKALASSSLDQVAMMSTRAFLRAGLEDTVVFPHGLDHFTAFGA